ncbi:MAG: hypothetical protein HIU90_04000 [Proteobacteria bacterium]|nr:hypothetical protein [Pseudomonadota bacterium]
MTNETFIVAARRTVLHDNQTFGPGDEVQLPRGESAQLIAGGFIHRPGQSPVFAVQVSMRPMDGNPAGIGHIGPVK